MGECEYDAGDSQSHAGMPPALTSPSAAARVHAPLVRWSKAEIIDFKTDQDPDPEKYRSQLENYQRVLGQLIGLREDSILTKLLFTRPKKIVAF